MIPAQNRFSLSFIPTITELMAVIPLQLVGSSASSGLLSKGSKNISPRMLRTFSQMMIIFE
jgi:hypothetical protein